MTHGKSMEKLEKAYRLLQQFPHGIRAADFAKKIGAERTAVYDVLNSLLYQGKAENKNNLWYPMQPSHEKEKTSEQKEKLIDTLTGYHEPEYFRKLP
jgi:DNA-binding IclR family transcriptional regulator